MCRTSEVCVGGFQGGVGVHGVAEGPQVLDGLAAAAHAVALGVGQAVQARCSGDGCELLADEEPFGEVGGDAAGDLGDEAEVAVGADDEVREFGQEGASGR
ncbi:hypothetical protein [Streptomyces sp. UH6]|uniref:hypothetical protein n=1 Tax=Streptomyces sp. UH6 TaxID=2748379 RepID=UPI0015D4759A|nr:hypothetical protein [Streptomyces sp. UH6]NYV75348.1 hypothetical protein [Streptomyces sp. UH6]